MNNHFFFSYAGNKRQEIKIIYNELEPILKDVKTIIEPYCGSGAMSYYISLLHPKKYKYILNDNNKMLIMLYRLVQEGIKEKEVEDKINKFIIKFNACKTNEERKIYYNSILKDDGCICSFIFVNKYYCMRQGLCPLFERTKELKPFKFSTFPIYNFIKNEDITFLNNDALNVINDYKDNKENLLLLDPPYIATCNDFYINSNMNIYEHLYNNNINNFICHIYLILENIWINKLLFNSNYISDSYDKKYEVSKKKTTHIIISKKK